MGAIAERNVTPILLEGLRRLEYRGYDSAGIVTLDQRDQRLHRTRTVGKVQALAERLRREPARGSLVSLTPAGPPTVSPANATPTRTSATIRWRWCTTASSKTIGNSGGTNRRRLPVRVRYRHRSRCPPDRPTDAGNRRSAGGGAAGRGPADRCLQSGSDLSRRSGTVDRGAGGSPLVLGIGIEEHFIARRVRAGAGDPDLRIP